MIAPRLLRRFPLPSGIALPVAIALGTWLAVPGVALSGPEAAAPKATAAEKQQKKSEAEPATEKSTDPRVMYSEAIAKLTPLQRHVTQEAGTEPPFRNEFYDNHREGIYVDIVSGKPLFSSLDKFDSGCGWPSFAKPLHADEVKESRDTTAGMIRIEVRSSTADSHLGHVFNDGPRELGGLRYCINSASLRFIPKEDLEKEGLGKYAALWEKKDKSSSAAESKDKSQDDSQPAAAAGSQTQPKR